MATIRKCSESGCENEVLAKGLCNTHYARQRRVSVASPKTEPERSRWEFEGDEAALIAAQEDAGRLQKLKERLVADVRMTEELRNAILNASTPAEIAELCLRAGEGQGLLAGERGSGMFTPTGKATAPEPKLPSDAGLIHEQVTCPDGLVREITAYSYSGLDTLREALIRQYPKTISR